MTTSLQFLHNWPFIMFRSTYRKLKGTKSKQIISGFWGTLQTWATTPERVYIQQQNCKDNYVSDLISHLTWNFHRKVLHLRRFFRRYIHTVIWAWGSKLRDRPCFSLTTEVTWAAGDQWSVLAWPLKHPKSGLFKGKLSKSLPGVNNKEAPPTSFANSLSNRF